MQSFEQQGQQGQAGRIIQSFRPWILLVTSLLAIFLVAKTVSEFQYPAGNKSPQPTITVQGKGEIYVKPDIATVSFGVTSESLDVAKAQTESAEKINAIMAALKKEGVADKDIKTTNYNIYPRYEYPAKVTTYGYIQEGKRTLAGYVVTQNVVIKIRELAKAGTIITTLGSLGATDVSGLSFEVDNDDAVKAQARAEAIAEAKAKAETMADALGVKLVRIVGFGEDYYYPVMYRAATLDTANGMGGAGAVPEIATGENVVTSNVSVTYEIR